MSKVEFIEKKLGIREFDLTIHEKVEVTEDEK